MRRLLWCLGVAGMACALSACGGGGSSSPSASSGGSGGGGGSGGSTVTTSNITLPSSVQVVSPN